jgi:hypothetical protein
MGILRTTAASRNPDLSTKPATLLLLAAKVVPPSMDPLKERHNLASFCQNRNLFGNCKLHIAILTIKLSPPHAAPLPKSRICLPFAPLQTIKKRRAGLGA